MRHHHHRPHPRRPQRTRSPSRARERREPPSIVTSSQSPPPLLSSCSRPVTVVTAASSPRTAQLLPVGAKSGHPPRATSPGVVAVAGGALDAVLLPARVKALPARRGECHSRPRTPCQGTCSWRQRHRRGRHDASVSSPAASVRPSFASGPPPPVLGGIAGQKWREGSGVVVVLCTLRSVVVCSGK